MSTYQELENEFKEKVKILQENCNHPFTEWMKQNWAPGHSTGFDVKVCEMCRAQIDKRPTKW